MLNTFDNHDKQGDRLKAREKQLELMSEAGNSLDILTGIDQASRDGSGGEGDADRPPSPTDANVSKGTFEVSFSAGMHAPPLGATDDAKRFLWDEDDETPDEIPSRGFGGSDSGMFGSSRKIDASAAAPTTNLRTIQAGGHAPPAWMFNAYDSSTGQGAAGGAGIGDHVRGIFGAASGFVSSRFASTAADNKSSGAPDWTSKRTSLTEVNLRDNVNLYEIDESWEYGPGKSRGSGGAMLGTTLEKCCGPLMTRQGLTRACAILAAAAAVAAVVILRGGYANIHFLPSWHNRQHDLETLTSDPRFAAIKSRVLSMGISDPADLVPEWPPSPQFQALEWIARTDPQQLHPNSPYIFQRYALATFWLSTYGKVVEEAENVGEGAANAAAADEGIWIRRTNWMSDAGLCSWEGVQCHHRPGGPTYETTYDDDNMVTMLDLVDNEIRGTLPREIFTALTDMRMLRLSRNNLEGHIPDEVSQATQLMELDLNTNNFDGQIPGAIGSLKNLQRLDLSDCFLTGAIPTELANLEALQEFALYKNSLDSTIPANLAKMKQLKSLYLDSNYLSGAIPGSLAELTQLADLRLRDNKLTSSIPPGLSQLENLEVLYLDSNQLTGSIPYQLHKLRVLEELHLYRNKLAGSLSPSLFTLDKLKEFYADHNELSGPLPSEIEGLKSIEQIYLYANELTGTIPTTVSRLTSLKRFRIYGNAIFGTIPAEMGNLFKLEHLSLEDCRLEGKVPSEFSTLVNLQKLYIQGNEITGEVPEGVCKLTQDTLSEFLADCGGDEPRLVCECCTECM